MTAAAAVAAELRLLAERVRGGANPADTVEALLVRARLVARQAQQKDLQDMREAMDTLTDAVCARMDEIALALRETGSRRSAISAYGSTLRPFQSAQNLRTRV